MELNTISKKDFKAMHEAGELQLICGGVKKSLIDVVKAIESVKTNIQDYCKPTSRYGEISDTNDGYRKCNIYRSEDEQFIFIEEIIDNSKCRTCSWDTVETFVSAYLAC